MKKFEIPQFYKSQIISRIKELRSEGDLKKKDFSPTFLDFGPVQFFAARHFGFCYGVENAIEIIYKTIQENQGKRIFLISEMIHNPKVNQDLLNLGVRFMMDTLGNQLIEWDDLNADDIVVVPAFGTTIEIEKILSERGLDVKSYDTTCPFVTRVWKKSSKLGSEDYALIIHGKPNHEETRATFSHSKQFAPALVIKDIREAQIIAEIITQKRSQEDFKKYFKDRYTNNFSIEKDLAKFGVINQTTMLANETQAISDCLKGALIETYGIENIKDHCPDTRDTLCYATYDNQRAVSSLLDIEADFAIVVGGYNSSNTSHLVELCENKLDTYFISSQEQLISKDEISHFDFHNKIEKRTQDFIKKKEEPLKILITSGASCPDSVVDGVIMKLVSYFENPYNVNDVLNKMLVD